MSAGFDNSAINSAVNGPLENVPLMPDTRVLFSSGPDFALSDMRFSSPERSLRIDPRLAYRIAQILDREEYVSVELERGGKIYTAHITHPADRRELLSVHVVSDEINPSGARLTTLHGRFQYNPGTEGIRALESDTWTLEETVERIEQFLEQCNNKWTLVQCNPQGFHERQQDDREAGNRLGRGTDTGGQNGYVEGMSKTAARQGFNVIIANRAGPSQYEAELGLLRASGANQTSISQAEKNYASHADLRIGKHYKHDFVHLFFIDDGCRGVHDERVFVPKESFYPALDERGRQREDKHFRPMAEHLAYMLRDQKHIATVIGHYADGAAVGMDLVKLRTEAGLGPAHFHYDPHSVGEVKRRNYAAQNKSEDVMAALRFPERLAVEKAVTREAARSLWTSDEIRDALVSDLGADRARLVAMPPGVDIEKFQPREEMVPRHAPRYAATWRFLAEHMRDGRELPPEGPAREEIIATRIQRLQRAKLVTEISRPDEASKDKPTATRAVGELIRELRALGKTDMPVYFVVNAQGKVREDVEAAAQKYNMERRLIIVPGFPEKQVQDMYQISDIYLTASLMEGFGMSAEQAAACRLILVSSTLVPFAREVLSGGQQAETHISSARLGRRIIIQGEGAFLFNPGDHLGAAHAMAMILTGQGNTNRMVSYAYDRTVPSLTWHEMLRNFMIEHVGMVYDDGHVKPPPSNDRFDMLQ